jgi:hypothetical protein
VTRPPIISAIQPASDGLIPPGAVTLGARVAGSTDLTEVELSLDGAPLQPRVTTQDARTWTVAISKSIEEPGRHIVRITAKDRDGRAGGFTWSFEVGEVGVRPSPSPRAR